MPKSKNKLASFFKWLFAIGFFFAIAAAAGVYLLYNHLSPQLPAIDVLKDVRLQVPLRVFSSDGELIAEYGEKRREPVLIEEVPELLKNAYIAAEDDRFYEHPGVDYQGLLRAGVNLIKTGEKGQGGSTITMQVARNFFLTREKTYLRKVNEILLALKIEKELSKDKILELYLNKIYLGNRSYGVGAAASVYYGVSLDELTLAQIAMIAGLPKAPSKFNPIADPERALIRRDYVLNRMYLLGMIDEKQYSEAKAEGISAEVHGAAQTVDAGYVGEMARAALVELFQERAYTAGLKVYTTIKSKQQSAANIALRKALLAYEQRQGYRGPVGTAAPEVLADPELIETTLADYPAHGGLLPSLVLESGDAKARLYVQGGEEAEIVLEDLEWAGKRAPGSKGTPPEKVSDVLAPGDVVYTVKFTDKTQLAQMPRVEGALVALDPNDGAIQALVGGFDFNRSKFNRVTQAERQPGSNFKPFIYSAALEKGYTAATTINDAPVVFDDPALEDEWRPENYSGKFYGPTRFREALVKSRNLVSIRILIELGLPYVMEYIERFGFADSNLPRDLSLALGSGTLKPLQVANAYATFANGGFLVDPYLIDRVEDIDGTILYQTNPAVVCADCKKKKPKSGSEEEESLVNHAERVLDERNVYIMRSILRDVVQRGTAVRAKTLGRRDLGGKTGTTNDQHDAWFSGFNNNVVATAWVGYDQQIPLGARETGGRAALPMWIDYMREALKEMPENEQTEPEKMTSILIDPATGALANADNGDAIFEMFRVEYAPKPAVVTASGTVKTQQEIQQQEQTTEELF